MDWTKDQVRSGGNKEYLSDKVEMVELTPEYKELRMIGPSRMVAVHNLRINVKKKDEAKGREVGIPKLCLAYDEETKKFDKGPCPYCDIDSKQPGFIVYSNVIDRELQEGMRLKPLSAEDKEIKRMNGHKCRIATKKADKSKTHARLWRITASCGSKISDLTGLNKVNTDDGKKVFPPQDPLYGFDLNVKYDKSKPPTEMYGCVKADKTKLSKEERMLLLWDVNTEQPEDLKTAKDNAKDLAKKLVDKKDEDSEDDDAPKKGKKDTKKTKKSDPESEDWDEDEDFEDDEDEDDAPKSKKGKKRPADEDDDDEDERPAKKKKKKPDPDDDEDEDDDDGVPWDEDDEDEDEPPAKKKKKVTKEPPAKKKKRPDPDEDEDDDDDDDWGDDEDEDDEPPAKKKKKKPVEDDEDDEDDERPAKKKKKKRPADDDDDEDEDARERPRKKKTKAKPVEDDDDDDWGDDDDDD